MRSPFEHDASLRISSGAGLEDPLHWPTGASRAALVGALKLGVFADVLLKQDGDHLEWKLAVDVCGAAANRGDAERKGMARVAHSALAQMGNFCLSRMPPALGQSLATLGATEDTAFPVEFVDARLKFADTCAAAREGQTPEEREALLQEAAAAVQGTRLLSQQLKSEGEDGVAARTLDADRAEL